MAEPIVVLHQPNEQRFCVTLEGYVACLMYRQHGQEVEFYHTYVPEVFRGRGIAERLCQAAFEYAQQAKLTVMPSCAYVSDYYLRRHPEYEPMVKRRRASKPIVSG